MINITDKSKCCGCCACVDNCAHKAITLKNDIEGFWYPEVNTDLCSECGLCEKHCPQNIEIRKELKNARKVYEQFKEDGEVMFGAETITTEEELKSKFTEFLSDEEIAGIFKGGE